MKRLLVAILISFVASTGYCIDVYKSSNTATADTAKTLCNSVAPGTSHAIVHGVCVNTGAAGTLTLYNAWASAANPIAAVDTAAKGCQYYDVLTSSGLSYTNSATANVTIMYDCK